MQSFLSFFFILLAFASTQHSKVKTRNLMNILILHSYPSLSLLHLSCTFKPKTPTIKPIRVSSATTNPARDRVIDFGKHKGKMLGTLPSNYLRWVSKNLRARDFEGWAKLADQVLEDPVYRDRIEWELAEKVLNGDVSFSVLSRSGGAVSELLEISERFGWDNKDKVGWRKIDFGLLGTSKGGRIPRVSDSRGVERELRLKTEKIRNCGGGGGEKRRERIKLKSSASGGLQLLGRTEKMVRMGIRENGKDRFEGGIENDVVDFEKSSNDQKNGTPENWSPFPGRESLLKRVLRGKRL